MPSFPPLYDQLKIGRSPGSKGGRVFGGDVRSANWDGGGDLSAGADTEATKGYLIDYGTGAAQFQTIYAVDGSISGDMSLAGDMNLSGDMNLAGTGRFTTDAGSGSRLDIVPWSGSGSPMKFYSGDSLEITEGRITIETGAGNRAHLYMYGPTMGSGSNSGNGYIAAGGSNSLAEGTAGVHSVASGTFDAATSIGATSISGDASITLLVQSTSGGLQHIDFKRGSTLSMQIGSDGTAWPVNDLYLSESASQYLRKTGSGDLYIQNEVTGGDTYVIGNATGFLALSGGSGTALTSSGGANIELYGTSHATLANRAYYDASLHTFRDYDVSPTFVEIDSQGVRIVPGGSASAPSLAFNNGGTYNAGFYWVDGTNRIYATVGNNSSAFFTANGVYAAFNNVEQLGNDTVEWKDVWATDTTINSSDPRKKKDIMPLSESVDATALVQTIAPIQFKWKGGTRDHWGWNVEQVAQSIAAQGLEPGDYGVYIDPVYSHTDEYLAMFPEAKDQPVYKHMRQAELLPILWEEVRLLRKELELVKGIAA